jgi:6-phosphogluconolactonase (cycloisomerase 2 family)
LLVSLAAGTSAKPLSSGMVYTETNDASGNAVVVFQRAYNGTLTRLGMVSSGGLGTGTELGSQGAVAVSDNNQWVFAVDAGSNQISSFLITPNGLALIGAVDSGGQMPISLTQNGDRLFVLNAGGDGNISGFHIDENGALTAMADSTRPLSGSATNPAQISFTPDGQKLIVTERATNSIDVYTIDYFGAVSGPNVQVSSGPVPYGFAVDRFGHLIVSEAGTNTMSSYAIDTWSGDLSVISGSVATKQMAPCWVTIAGNGRYAYTTDAASNTITGYQIIPNGRLRLLNKNGLTATTGVHPTDMAIGANGRYLYARNSDGTINAFRVGNDGSLAPLAGVTGLPNGTTGLAGN